MLIIVTELDNVHNLKSSRLLVEFGSLFKNLNAYFHHFKVITMFSFKIMLLSVLESKLSHC